jgi:Uncharacterized iron-regulated membrane protein
MSAPALPDDPGGLRLALNWFHTWFGLFAGGLLFVIFWAGTLSVFDREIDRRMMPSTRLSPACNVGGCAASGCRGRYRGRTRLADHSPR